VIGTGREKGDKFSWATRWCFKKGRQQAECLAGIVEKHFFSDEEKEISPAFSNWA